MPTTYLTPGVYVEEVPSANKPIEGVSTSVAAFVGLAPGGPVNTAVRVSNWSQFARTYRDPSRPDGEDFPFMKGAYLAHSVYGFFNNGGTLAWVVRIGDENGSAPRARASLPAATDGTIEAFSVVAREGAEPTSIEIAEEPPVGEDAEQTYAVKISPASGPPEEFSGLTVQRGRNKLVTKLNQQSKLITIEETESSLPEDQRVPATGTYPLSAPSIELRKVKPAHFEGDVARRRGLGGLAAVDEVTMVLMPDVMALAAENGSYTEVRDLQGKMIAHCESTKDRMAILDPPPDLLPDEVLDWRMNTAGYDSKFATLYYPWIEVGNPLDDGKPLMIPPSGHMAGIWCRTDATRGVHKAPANEVVLGANGLAFQVMDAEQGTLNLNGVNCIRAFPGRGIRVWGARTLSSDPEWRYINVRRLFNFISESIMAGTQWSVFEPNDEKLWIQLRIAVSNFLTRVWSDGALFGSTPAQAFYVKCDEETNPPEDIEAGKVTCEIGIAPVKPAEFVIFRLSQFSGGEGSAVSE
jgi:phage tail sheath protein FI